MKQKKRMLLLVGILVVLCGAYGGIKAWNDQMKTQKVAKKKAQTVQIIDADDLTKISYKKGNKNMGMANHHGCSYPLMSIMIYSITIINPVYFSFL